MPLSMLPWTSRFTSVSLTFLVCNERMLMSNMQHCQHSWWYMQGNWNVILTRGLTNVSCFKKKKRKRNYSLKLFFFNMLTQLLHCLLASSIATEKSSFNTICSILWIIFINFKIFLFEFGILKFHTSRCEVFLIYLIWYSISSFI